MGCISPNPDFVSKRSKIDPWTGPYQGRGEAANPLAFGDKLSKGCMQLVRKGHCHVFLGGLDPGQAPLKTLLLMLRLTKFFFLSFEALSTLSQSN